jgi:hypothetical protein
VSENANLFAIFRVEVLSDEAQWHEKALKTPRFYGKNMKNSNKRRLFDTHQRNDCLRTQFRTNVWSLPKIAVTLHRQNQTKGCDKDNKTTH